jgi:hypothetical protein
MNRRLTALAGLLGLAWLRSRRRPAVVGPPPPQADPAGELRAKLAEARAADDRDEFESGEKPVDEAVSVGDKATDAPPPGETSGPPSASSGLEATTAKPSAPGETSGEAPDVETRRRDVHDRARAAIEELEQQGE